MESYMGFAPDSGDRGSSVGSTSDMGGPSGENIGKITPERGFTGHFPVRKIKDLFPEQFKILEDKLQKVVGHYIRRIEEQDFGKTKRYISDVILLQGQEHRDRCIRHLRQESGSYMGKLFIWVVETDHLHIVHDCPWSNGSCRCRILDVPFIRRHVQKSVRRTKYISELDRTDYEGILLYFIVSKWESEREIWIGRRIQRLPDQDEIVQWQDLSRTASELLARETEGGGHIGPEGSSYNDPRGSDIYEEFDGTSKKRRAIDDGPRRAKETKWTKILSKIQAVLTEFMPIPAVHVRDLLVGIPEYEYLHDPNIDKYYTNACSYYVNSISNFNFIDFYNLYNNRTPIFYANNLNPFSYYHTREDSFQYLNRLLTYQLGGDTDIVREFLFNMKEWFNRKGWAGNPKINAIAVIGPPNSGKNYFFDAVASIAYNVGHIGRVNNKTNNFALQECYSKRFIVGNEISMEEGAKEDFKKLCEGTALNIRVKYQGDKIYKKTPVLLISNSMLDICSDPAFKGIRLVTFTWNVAPFLRDSTLKPYPLAIFDLYNMYGINMN